MMRPGDFRLIDAAIDESIESLGQEGVRLREIGLPLDHPEIEALVDEADSLRRAARWLIERC